MDLSQIPNINSNSCRAFPVEKENDFQGSTIFGPPGLTFSAAFIFQGEAFSTFLVQKHHTGTSGRKPYSQGEAFSTVSVQKHHSGPRGRKEDHFPHKRQKHIS